MKRIFCIYVVLAIQGWAARTPKKSESLAPFDPQVVNDVNVTETIKRGASRAAVVRAQILLDRANFSSGEIDGAYGSNLRKAISAFQTFHGSSVTGEIGPSEWNLLNSDTKPTLISYAITEADLAGPFVKVPADMLAKSKLEALGYESAVEALAERFHASPGLLSLMNPNATFQTAGEEVLVPNVESAVLPKTARVIVDKSERSVKALDEQGKTMAYYPATIGSRRDPLPIGKWKINGVQWNPPLHYNPKLFWDADPSHSKAKIAPGPNNPVGTVWIDLSKEHYGIHGTPEPKAIGKTQSHGCIRLTNWDAVELGSMVAPGVTVILQE